jgi:hypothetical protein
MIGSPSKCSTILNIYLSHSPSLYIHHNDISNGMHSRLDPCPFQMHDGDGPGAVQSERKRWGRNVLPNDNSAVNSVCSNCPTWCQGFLNALQQMANATRLVVVDRVSAVGYGCYFEVGVVLCAYAPGRSMFYDGAFQWDERGLLCWLVLTERSTIGDANLMDGCLHPAYRPLSSVLAHAHVRNPAHSSVLMFRSGNRFCHPLIQVSSLQCKHLIHSLYHTISPDMMLPLATLDLTRTHRGLGSPIVPVGLLTL